MFKVTFRDTKDTRDLTKGLHLQAVPNIGDMIHIRERVYHGSSLSGRVTARHWHIATKEPGESEVVVFVDID